MNCCTAYPFVAEETQKNEYHQYVTPGPVASGADEYNYDMIYDPVENGAYHMYWSSATNPKRTGSKSQDTAVVDPSISENKKLGSRELRNTLRTISGDRW